jgi:hypothetical protein
MAKKKGVSLAQSGGINKTFGGGKGGLGSARNATTERKTGGGGELNNGLHYNIRSAGGDDALTSGKGGSIGKTPPLRGGGIKTSKVKVQKPARGGGR